MINYTEREFIKIGDYETPEKYSLMEIIPLVEGRSSKKRSPGEWNSVARMERKKKKLMMMILHLHPTTNLRISNRDIHDALDRVLRPKWRFDSFCIIIHCELALHFLNLSFSPHQWQQLNRTLWWAAAAFECRVSDEWPTTVERRGSQSLVPVVGTF